MYGVHCSYLSYTELNRLYPPMFMLLSAATLDETHTPTLDVTVPMLAEVYTVI